MTSTSFITGTGFMKCMPITRSGRPVAAAILVMLMELVLVARMQPSSGAAASRSAKIFSFRSTFSVAASTTNSAWATAAAKSVEVVNRPRAASLSAAEIFSLATMRSMFLPMVASARSKASAERSIMTTWWPACAKTWAIPLPMVPAPMTVTFMTGFFFLGSRLLGRRLFAAGFLAAGFLAASSSLLPPQALLLAFRSFKRERAFADEQVVPLHEFLQVALVHAVVVEFRHNAVHEVANHLRGVLVRRASFGPLGVVHAVQDVQQRHIVIVRVHGDVGEVADAGGAGHAGALAVHHAFHNDAGAARGQHLIQAGLAGHCENVCDLHCVAKVRKGRSTPRSRRGRRKGLQGGGRAVCRQAQTPRVQPLVTSRTGTFSTML